MGAVWEIFPAMGASDGISLTASGSDVESWSEISDRLAKLDTFSNSYFVHLSILCVEGEEKSLNIRNGSLEIDQDRGFIVKCWYYRTDAPSAARALVVTTDGTVLEASSDTEWEILSRYDEVEFWFHAKRVAQTTRRMLSVVLPGNNSDPAVDNDLTTRVSIPVIINRPVAPRLFRVSATAAGAALVATPALLGPGAQLQHKLIFAVLGALILAIVTVFPA
jgi:hypothetical protein